MKNESSVYLSDFSEGTLTLGELPEQEFEKKRFYKKYFSARDLANVVEVWHFFDNTEYQFTRIYTKEKKKTLAAEVNIFGEARTEGLAEFFIFLQEDLAKNNKPTGKWEVLYSCFSYVKGFAERCYRNIKIYKTRGVEWQPKPKSVRKDKTKAKAEAKKTNHISEVISNLKSRYNEIDDIKMTRAKWKDILNNEIEFKYTPTIERPLILEPNSCKNRIKNNDWNDYYFFIDTAILGKELEILKIKVNYGSKANLICYEIFLAGMALLYNSRMEITEDNLEQAIARILLNFCLNNFHMDKNLEVEWDDSKQIKGLTIRRFWDRIGKEISRKSLEDIYNDISWRKWIKINSSEREVIRYKRGTSNEEKKKIREENGIERKERSDKGKARKEKPNLPKSQIELIEKIVKWKRYHKEFEKLSQTELSEIFQTSQSNISRVLVIINQYHITYRNYKNILD